MIYCLLLVAVGLIFAGTKVLDLHDRPCLCCGQRGDSVAERPYCADCPGEGRECRRVSGYSLHRWRP